VTGRAPGLPVEDRLAAQLARAGLAGIQLAVDVELGRRRKVQQRQKLGMKWTCDPRSRTLIPFFAAMHWSPVKGGEKVRRVADQNRGTLALCTPSDAGVNWFLFTFSIHRPVPASPGPTDPFRRTQSPSVEPVF